MQLRLAQVGLRLTVDLAFERRGECAHRFNVRAWFAGWRHHPGAQFSQHALGDLCIFVGAARIEYLEFESARIVAVVVAAEAILVEKVALRSDGHRLRRRRHRTGQQCARAEA